MRQDDREDEMAWASFVEAYRRRRAPAALRARIVAALEAAARAGSPGEARRRLDDRRQGNGGSDAADVRRH